MATPNGRRSSEPAPVPKASGIAPNSAAIVVIMMGRKRSWQAEKIASSALFFPSRCSPRATSTIMMAFFFTMPTSRIRPMIVITERSMCRRNIASRAPNVADGSEERIVIGWTKLSYNTPRMMYTTAIAATISSGWLDRES